jgi:plasmid replication initiation protein
MKELINEQERTIVRKNQLINGKVKLKAKSYDLVRSLASLVDFNDTDFWTYQIKASDLDIDYKRAKEYIRDIMRNPIEIKDDEKEIFECYAWCSSIKYKNGIIEAKFDPDMREFLLQIKGNYTKTHEKYLLAMDSVYAKRIYEMLMQNIDFGYRKFVLADLQEVLNVPKSLIRYDNFKRKVLLIAIKEINKHTDIYIPVDTENLKDDTWKKLQCGQIRKITHLNFEFRKKDDKGLFEIQNTDTSIEDEIRSAIDIDYYPDDLKPFYIERLLEFIDYCVKNNKRYPDWEVSFDRHIKGYIKALKNNDNRV